MLRYDCDEGQHMEHPKVDAFLREIDAVCERYGFAIQHEDYQGAFVIVGYGPRALDGLIAAQVKLSE